jgi:cytochrome P450
MHKFADEIIQEAIDDLRTGKQNPNGRYVFLHALLSQTQDPYALRSELLNILLAGRDTTAGLLSNTWHVLSKRPDVWAKLKAEVDELGGEKPDYTTIKEMKYLKWTLNESLRLMPVVPGNSREAMCDTILPLGGGVDGKAPALVRKGEVVGYSPWSSKSNAFYPCSATLTRVQCTAAKTFTDPMHWNSSRRDGRTCGPGGNTCPSTEGLGSAWASNMR